MATLRQYFDLDFARLLSAANTWEFADVHGRVWSIPIRLHLDFDANACFLSAFLPEADDWAPLLDAVLQDASQFVAILGGTAAIGSGVGPEQTRWAATQLFAGRFFIYADCRIATVDAARVTDYWSRRGIFLQLRDLVWAEYRSAREPALAFIAHDSRDKDDYARPLAAALVKLSCSVWYDEYSLKVGDRLRESIERGLRECHKCVLLVTPHWLSNPGWTRTEFDSVFMREHIEGKDVILPVWCDVSPNAVYQYSPALANRVAITWSGEDRVASELRRALVGNASPA